MDALELRQLIAAGERPTVDFKQEFDSGRECAKDFTCFANSFTGRILFGVTKSGTVVGVEDVDELLLRLDTVAHEHCHPPVTVLSEVVELEEGPVVVVTVPHGSDRPYRTKSGQHYIRSGTRCRQPSREELLRLFQGVESLYYDEQPVVGTSWADLDERALEQHLRSTGREESVEQPPERLLQNWRCWDGKHLTVAGLLLFGQEPTAHLPYAKIVAASFPGTTVDAESLERADLEGRLPEQVAGAASFLGTHLVTGHRITGFEPERYPELPETALREAIANAIAHRDYTIRAPIRLFVFSDRLEVRTPGRPPNTMDPESMRTGVHLPRNPHLYKRLYDLGMVTQVGSGIPRMVRLVRESTGRDLGLEVVNEEFVVTMPRPDAD